MSNLTRYNQKIFGTSAGANEMAEYGSLVGDPPGNLYSGAMITPDIVQNLSQFEGGLYAAVNGAYSPTIQDQNSLFYLITRQLAYIFQKGIPEWNSETTYFLNDFVRVDGNLFVSLQNTNLNHLTTDPLWWSAPNITSSFIAPVVNTFALGSGTYVVPTTPRPPLYLRVRMCGGGGGGGGSGLIGSAGDGGDGGVTTFGPDLIAYGGTGGKFSSAGGVGGNASTVLSAFGFALKGQNGAPGMIAQFDPIITGEELLLLGGGGGNNAFGCAGAGGIEDGFSSDLQSGGGGGGAGITQLNNEAQTNAGGGGGAGGYLECTIYEPNGTYDFSVSDDAVGGSAGTDGFSGGGGGRGFLIVEEYYQ